MWHLFPTPPTNRQELQRWEKQEEGRLYLETRVHVWVISLFLTSVIMLGGAALLAADPFSLGGVSGVKIGFRAAIGLSMVSALAACYSYYQGQRAQQRKVDQPLPVFEDPKLNEFITRYGNAPGITVRDMLKFHLRYYMPEALIPLDRLDQFHGNIRLQLGSTGECIIDFRLTDSRRSLQEQLRRVMKKYVDSGKVQKFEGCYQYVFNLYYEGRIQGLEEPCKGCPHETGYEGELGTTFTPNYEAELLLATIGFKLIQPIEGSERQMWATEITRLESQFGGR